MRPWRRTRPASNKCATGSARADLPVWAATGTLPAASQRQSHARLEGPPDRIEQHVVAAAVGARERRRVLVEQVVDAEVEAGGLAHFHRPEHVEVDARG